MLKVQRFVCNMLQENCYVVSDESRECVIIDCGAFFPEEKKEIRSKFTTTMPTSSRTISFRPKNSSE